MREHIEVVTADENGEEIAVKFPARWVICPACEGCGTDRGASVECDGGGFTASEWAGWTFDMDRDEAIEFVMRQTRKRRIDRGERNIPW